MNVMLMILFVFLVVPGSLIAHEIGHVIGAKLKKATTIRLTIGSGLPLFRITILNIEVIVNVVFIFGSFTSTIRETPFKPSEKIIITIFGPIVNSLLAIIFYIAYDYSNAEVLYYLVFLFNVWLAVINIIPYKIGIKQSDGYIVYKILLNKFTKQE